MASRTTKLKITTEANTSALKKTAEEVKKVDKATQAASKSQVALGAEGVKASKRNSYAAGQAAMQFQDIAVQAQMGTDAVRIMSQQGPQMLSAFGPQGMIAGAALAIGGALVTAFTTAGKSAEELEEEVATLAETMREAAELRFKAMEDSLELVSKRAELAQQSFDSLIAQQDRLSQGALDSANAAIQAELDYRKLLGENTDAEQAALDLAKEEEKITQQRNKAVNEQVNANDKNKETLKQTNAERDITIEKIKAANDQLRIQEGLMEKAFEQQVEAATPRRRLIALGMAKGIKQSELDAATEKFDERSAAVRDTLANIESLQKTLEGQNNTIRSLTFDIEQGQSAIQEVVDNADIETNALNASAGIKAINDSLAALSADTQAGMAAVEGLPTTNKAIFAQLAKLLEDGIQTNEVEQVIRSLQILKGSVQGAFTVQDKTINQIIDGLAGVQTLVQATDRRVQKLEASRTTKGP